MPVFTWRRDSKDRTQSAEDALLKANAQAWTSTNSHGQQLKSGTSSSRPGTSRLASGSTSAHQSGFTTGIGTAGGTLLRTSTSPSRGSAQQRSQSAAAYSGVDAGRPATAAGAGARQHASAVAAYLARPMSSGSLGISTAQHDAPPLPTRHSAGHPVQAAGSVYLAAARPGSSGGLRSAVGSGNTPTPVRQGSASARYSGEFFVGSPTATARTPSVDTLLANVQLTQLQMQHDVHAWHEGGPAQPGSPAAATAATAGSAFNARLTSMGEPPAAAGYPAGLPPPSPSRLSASLKLMPRSSSARQDQHSSLLATLMVQQVHGSDPGSPLQRGGRAGAFSPGSGARGGARKASGKVSAAQRGMYGNGGAASAASSPKASYSARPGTSHAGAAARPQLGGVAPHGPAAAAAAAAAADHLLQRRFSTGSVAASQQWADQIAELQRQEQQQQQAAGRPGVPAVASRGGGLAEGWGTLTCVRPSTAHGSNFALAFSAESQHEFSSAQPPSVAAADPAQPPPLHPTPGAAGTGGIHQLQVLQQHQQHQQQHSGEEPVSPAAWAVHRPGHASEWTSVGNAGSGSGGPGGRPHEWAHATHFAAPPPGRPPLGAGPSSPTKSSRTLVALPAGGAGYGPPHPPAGSAASGSIQQMTSHGSAASSRGSHAEPTHPAGEWAARHLQQQQHAQHEWPMGAKPPLQHQATAAAPGGGSGRAAVLDHHHHLGGSSEATASGATDMVQAQSSSLGEPSSHVTPGARGAGVPKPAPAAARAPQPQPHLAGASGHQGSASAAPTPLGSALQHARGSPAAGTEPRVLQHMATVPEDAAATAAMGDAATALPAHSQHHHAMAWAEQPAVAEQPVAAAAEPPRPGTAASASRPMPTPVAQQAWQQQLLQQAMAGPRVAASRPDTAAAGSPSGAAAAVAAYQGMAAPAPYPPPPPPSTDSPQRPSIAQAAAAAAAPKAAAAVAAAVSHADGRTDSAAPGGEGSTNPLHMFASLASKRVPIYPPRLPHSVDEVTLLNGHVSSDHTAALPGYAVGKVIGEGGFCQVRLAVHRLSGRRVAVKVIDKTKLADAGEARRIQREIRVMRHLNHECIVKLFEVVDVPTLLYLVMEHAPSGSLLDFVRTRKRLPEQDAVVVVKQIVVGLAYCHQREVVHRDIKLENILLDANNCMKLIDFGLSAFYIPGKQLRVHCGSPSYAAPEIVSRKHYDGPPVDVWSLGVVLFAMLVGHLPFHSSAGNKQELCAKIIEGRYNCPDFVSAPAKDLLSKMLCVDPSRRIRLDQIVQHTWLTQGAAWQPIGASVYMCRCDLSAGLVFADEQLIMELEAAGYARQTILQYLLAGDANYITATYYLMAEGKVEVIRRMRGSAAAQRYIARAAPPFTDHASSAAPGSGGASSAASGPGAAGPLTSATVAVVAGGLGGGISSLAGVTGGMGSGKLATGGVVSAVPGKALQVDHRVVAPVTAAT